MTTLGPKFLDFFQPLVEAVAPELKRPSTKATASQSQWFYSGFKGITYNAGFWYEEGPYAAVYLWIAEGDAARNAEILSKLRERQKSVEDTFGAQLEWFPVASLGIASRVSRRINGPRIHDDFKQLLETRLWMIENITRLKSAIQPHLEEISDELGLQKEGK